MPGQLENGKKLGERYEIREPLGRGGMASVYRAYQSNLDRDVAIKVMAEQFATDPTFKKRFQREANAIARLNHPNILKIYDQGEDNGLLFIVMELIEGETLKDQLNIQPISPERCAEILIQIAGALDYANGNGIIHRDVKPSNVLMDPTGRAVLSDFGIAKMAEANTQLTSTGMGVGTPDYMSPEQAMGEPLDVRSDEYSLGVMVYEMLTGRVPFTGDTPIAIVMGHISKPLPSVRSENQQIPATVEPVMIKALAKKPEERYENCSAFARAFAEAVRGTVFEPLPPTQVLDTSNLSLNASQNTAAEQIYRQARLQEQQNNYYGAYDTFKQLNERFPNYRDVPSVLANYHHMGYGRNQGPLPTMSNITPPNTPPPVNGYYTPIPPSLGSYTPAPQMLETRSRPNNRNLIFIGIGLVLILAVMAAIFFSGNEGRRPNPNVTIVTGGLPPGSAPGGNAPGGAPGAGGLPGGVPQLIAPRDTELYSAAPYNKDGISIPSVIVRPLPAGGGSTIYGLLTNTTGEPISFSGTANILDANDKILEQNVPIQTLRVIAPNATVPFVIQANQSRNGKRPDWKINAKPFRQDPAAAKIYPHNYFKSEKQSLKDGTPNMFAQGTVINTGPDGSGNLRAIMALYGPDNALLFVSPSVPLNESLDKGEEGDFDIPFPGLPKDPNVGINQVKFLIWFEGAK